MGTIPPSVFGIPALRAEDPGSSVGKDATSRTSPLPEHSTPCSSGPSSRMRDCWRSPTWRPRGPCPASPGSSPLADFDLLGTPAALGQRRGPGRGPGRVPPGPDRARSPAVRGRAVRGRRRSDGRAGRRCRRGGRVRSRAACPSCSIPEAARLPVRRCCSRMRGRTSLMRSPPVGPGRPGRRRRRRARQVREPATRAGTDGDQRDRVVPEGSGRTTVWVSSRCARRRPGRPRGGPRRRARRRTRSRRTWAVGSAPSCWSTRSTSPARGSREARVTCAMARDPQGIDARAEPRSCPGTERVEVGAARRDPGRSARGAGGGHGCLSARCVPARHHRRDGGRRLPRPAVATGGGGAHEHDARHGLRGAGRPEAAALVERRAMDLLAAELGGFRRDTAGATSWSRMRSRSAARPG